MVMVTNVSYETYLCSKFANLSNDLIAISFSDAGTHQQNGFNVS